jgi:2Fe-2S ferredoxin
MAGIRVTDRDGTSTMIEGCDGASVMQLLCGAGQDVQAICGGSAICGTCHVYVDESWLDRLPPAGSGEAELLSSFVHRLGNSRLSCQIPFSAALDGLTLTLAPEELV